MDFIGYKLFLSDKDFQSNAFKGTVISNGFARKSLFEGLFFCLDLITLRRKK